MYMVTKYLNFLCKMLYNNTIDVTIIIAQTTIAVYLVIKFLTRTPKTSPRKIKTIGL